MVKRQHQHCLSVGWHNVAMPLRSRRLPERAQLNELLGDKARVLAWALGPDNTAAAMTTAELAVYQDDHWCCLGWEKVLRGGWRAEDSCLFWETMSDAGSCVLEEPGELPTIFRERIQASTVMVVNREVPGGGVQIVARRELRMPGRVTWLANATGNADLTDPETAALVVEHTDRLRAEYGF